MPLITSGSRINHFAYFLPELKSYDLWINEYTFYFVKILSYRKCLKTQLQYAGKEENVVDSFELTLLCGMS